MAPRRQRPKRSKRAARVEARQDARQAGRQRENRQDARQEARQDARQARRRGQGNGPVPGTSPYPPGVYPYGPGQSTPGYPVPAGTSQYPGPLPGTTGTTELQVPGSQPDYSWSPEGERHAVTTNQLPDVSWPPVDLPAMPGGNFMNQEGPIDNGQANPSTIYGGADIENAQYYDYNEEAY